MRKFKTKYISAVLCLALTLTACGRPTSGTVVPPPSASTTEQGIITGETMPSNYVLPADQIQAQGLYVIHNGYAYPVMSQLRTYTDGPSTVSSSSRKVFFSIDSEIYIPTLYVQNGDKLIYISDNALLDTLTWERFYDFGYTIGIYDIYSMVNKRCYFDLSNDESIISVCELYDLYRLYEADESNRKILFDKIGNTQISQSMLDHGMFTGLKRGQVYDMDLYLGTHYMHYVVSCNIHMMYAMELFQSVEYITLKAHTFEIVLPEYLTTGYYTCNNGGVIRVVTDRNYYSNMTDYNERLLFPAEDSESVAIYSTTPELNHYFTELEGALGYYSPDTGEDPDDTSDTPPVISAARQAIRQYTITDYAVFDLAIETPESTADVYIINSDQQKLPVEYFSGGYRLTPAVKGSLQNGEEFTLVLSGFYDVDTVNLSYIGMERN